MAQSINVNELIDDRPIGRLQIVVFTLCAFVNLLDGMDTQSIGVAAPFIAQSLGLPMPQFGPIFSAGLLGATLGAIAFGMIADRVGRRRLLITAALAIGVFTLLTATAGTRESLMLYRFLAGVGLGGATPCFIAMTSEYAPARLRATVVTLMWASFPIGGMLGALANSVLINDYGWRAIFYLGGILPLVAAAALAAFLPESLKYLVASHNSGAKAARVLSRLGVSDVPVDALLAGREMQSSGVPLRQVLADGRLSGTLILWVPFFTGFCLLSAVVLWTPTLLRLNGISPGATALVVAFNGLGAAIGQGAAGRLVERFGIVRTMMPAYVLGAAATAALGYGSSSVAAASLFIGLNGLFLGIGTAGAIALSAMIYPTAVRSTGVGLAMAVGRCGQMVGPLFAGLMLGFGADAASIMLGFAALAVVGALFVSLFSRWLGRSKATAGNAGVPAV